MDKKTFLTTFFYRLNEESIDYFVYGSYLLLPDDTGGSDIDMIVDQKDLNKVKYILKEVITNSSVCLASTYVNVNANANFYRILSSSQQFGIQVDILYHGLCYKGIEYYPVRLLRERIIEHRGIKVLDIHKGYYVDYIKEIIHLGKTREKYEKAFLAEVNTDRIYYQRELIQLYGSQVTDLIFTNLSKEKLPKISKQLQKMLQKKVLKGHYGKRIIAKTTLLARLFQKRPGYVVVVEGTDGSGKSFIIDSITPILNEAFHNSVVYNHLRPNAIPDLGVLLGKKEKLKGVTVCTDPHAQKQSGFMGSLMRWGYYMIDYTLGYAKMVWPQIHAKSKVFIFDRYYYEYYFDPKRSRTKLPHWIIRLGEVFIPSPDLILCLGGDPDKIYARKPETSLKEVKRQTAVLKEFCQSRKNAVWVDTTIEAKESIKRAIEAVYDIMNKRFKP